MDGEAVPYSDASFDFTISEYGACLWADPRRWVPETTTRYPFVTLDWAQQWPCEEVWKVRRRA